MTQTLKNRNTDKERMNVTGTVYILGIGITNEFRCVWPKDEAANQAQSNQV